MSLNKRLLHNFDHCLNCETILDEDSHFCQKCGQRRTTGRISFRQISLQFIEDTCSWDARLFRTIRTLFIPGKLTTEFFSGKHVPYWQPLRLFLFMAAIQMIVVNATLDNVNEKIQKSNEELNKKVLEYVVLKKLDSLKIGISSQFENKKTAVDAMDKLLSAYQIKPNKKKKQLTLAQIGQKKDSLERVLRSEFEKEGVPIDTFAIKNEIEDFAKSLSESGQGINPFTTSLDADSISILFVKKGPNVDNLNWSFSTESKNKIADITVDTDNLINESKKNGSRLAISKIDFLNLTPDEIIDKYDVQGFYNKVVCKQTLKAMKDGKSGFAFFVSRLSWMIIFMMPFFALFLELVNRPYYYVEHVVFSFHCHAFLFFVVSLAFFANHYVIPESWKGFHDGMQLLLFFYLVFYFFFAMKRVYNQNNVKTAIKYVFLSFAYFLSLIIAIAATVVVSFFFF
ncbi:MAG: DUF3667 domain-containing protein [Saprospiraceae bacterium]